MTVWPLLDLTLTCRNVGLHVVRDEEIEPLADLLPDDVEQDPALESFPDLEVAADRRRLLAQGIWRSRGTWSRGSWCLDLAVEHEGRLVGIQTLEGDDFPTLQTVDSASWLAPVARGRGLGVAMRTAVLGLAFDHLGAQYAVSSAKVDNLASLGVSRSIGYLDNGLSMFRSPSGTDTLQHFRLARASWTASGLGQQVTVTGLATSRPWF